MTSHDRFWSKVNKLGPVFGRRGRCWLWTAATDKGYGKFREGGVGSKVVPAHVWAWRQEYGPVPAGLELDHLCRRKNCVRPSHCEAVTHAENIRRGDRRKMGEHNRRKSYCPSGHRYDHLNTYVDSASRRHCRKCERSRVRV